MKTRLLRWIAPLLLVVVVAPAARAGDAIFTRDGVAIRGSDPVAYFTDGHPAKGNPAITYKWMGATWQFATAAHRDAFAANPTKYAPQYGGYCAYAVSEGSTAPIDPAAWTIVNGKLYLNYSLGVRRMWRSDEPGNITKANRNWPGIKAKLERE